MRQFYLFGLIYLCALTAGKADPSPLAYAENFEIQNYLTHKLLTVKNISHNSSRTYRYALVPRGQEIPSLPDDISIIRTPVRRVIAMETVFIGYLDALDELDSIVGAATVHLISEPSVRERSQNGEIRSIQIGQSLDIESVLLLEPDLILTSISGDPAFDIPPKLLRSGLPVVITAGYMERHPLARSEWIKFIGAFFDASEKAEQVFDKCSRNYEMLTQLTASLSARPSVFSGAPHSGAWYVASGDSFTARAIHDAGGHYVWAEGTGQNGLHLDTERVLLKAADADYWIHPTHYRSLAELFGAEPRFDKFRATRIGQVYNNTKQVGPSGGNNIWERGIVRPDEVLADLIKVFHPELMPQHELIFYEQIQ